MSTTTELPTMKDCPAYIAKVGEIEDLTQRVKEAEQTIEDVEARISSGDLGNRVGQRQLQQATDELGDLHESLARAKRDLPKVESEANVWLREHYLPLYQEHIADAPYSLGPALEWMRREMELRDQMHQAGTSITGVLGRNPLVYLPNAAVNGGGAQHVVDYTERFIEQAERYGK